MTIGTAAGTFVPAKKKYLPNSILRAINTASELQGLTTGVRVTLQTICRYVNQHAPLGAVFTRRAKIADRAGLSVRSVDRHISKLESMGLVRVEDQRHGQRNGKFLVTHIYPTLQLARILGLVQAEDVQSQAQPSDKVASGHIYDLSGPSSSKKQGRQGTTSAPTIPADLARLVEMGLMPPTVCKLMREAREHGKRLSDVVDVVIDRLQELKLKGGQIRSYLAKAIASPSDFASLAARAREAQRKKVQDEADKIMISLFQAQYRGKVLRSPDGRETLAINSDGTYAQHNIGARQGTMVLSSRVDVQHVLDKIRDGRLVEGLSPPSLVVQHDPVRTAEVGRHLQALRSLVGIRR